MEIFVFNSREIVQRVLARTAARAAALAKRCNVQLGRDSGSHRAALRELSACGKLPRVDFELPGSIDRCGDNAREARGPRNWDLGDCIWLLVSHALDCTWESIFHAMILSLPLAVRTAVITPGPWGQSVMAIRSTLPPLASPRRVNAPSEATSHTTTLSSPFPARSAVITRLDRRVAVNKSAAPAVVSCSEVIVTRGMSFSSIDGWFKSWEGSHWEGKRFQIEGHLRPIMSTFWVDWTPWPVLVLSPLFFISLSFLRWCQRLPWFVVRDALERAVSLTEEMCCPRARKLTRNSPRIQSYLSVGRIILKC